MGTGRQRLGRLIESYVIACPLPCLAGIVHHRSLAKCHVVSGERLPQLGSCLVHPKTKKFSRFLVTSNLAAHAYSIKYR